jgi:hypothetical protein
MGSINYGMQTVSVQYFAAADAKVVNKRHIGVRPRGIYNGGYISKVSNTIVSVNPMICEIGDNEHQVRIATENAASITVSASIPYVVLRWSYAESNTNYMDMLALAVGSILPNDIIVGKCVFAGATLSSFDYSLRETPNVFDIFLKVQPTATPSMRVRIRAGRVNYGSANLDVIDQQSAIFIPPTNSGDKRIDVIYVDTDGNVKTYSGSESPTPVAPLYNNKKVLAEVTLETGQTEILTGDIKDVRSWL